MSIIEANDIEYIFHFDLTCCTDEIVIGVQSRANECQSALSIKIDGKTKLKIMDAFNTLASNMLEHIKIKSNIDVKYS